MSLWIGLLIVAGLGVGVAVALRRPSGVFVPPVPAIPAFTYNAITGTPQDGQTLTAARTVTGYPSPLITYQWQKNGTNIAGQTGQTITLSASGMGLVEGDVVSCEITAANASGSVTVEASKTFAVPTIAPAFTSSSISGTAQDGQTLTANNAATGTPTPTITYQWQRNGTNISGQTSQTIALSASTMSLVNGDTISCEITATNTAGTVTVEVSVTFDAAAVATLAAPVLSNLATGWTAGQNPPAWDALFTDPIDYDEHDGTGDKARARYKLNGAASWTVSEWLPFDEVAYAEGFKYTFLTNGTTAGGGTFEVQEMHGRDVGLATEILSPWSNSWQDTLSSPVQFNSIADLAPITTVDGNNVTFPLVLPATGRPAFGYYVNANASPVFTVRKTSDNSLVATASATQGGGIQRAPSSDRHGLLITDNAIPAGNYVVTVTAAGLQFPTILRGFVSGGAGSITGTAYSDFGNTTNGVVSANQAITVNAGGIMLVFARGENGLNPGTGLTITANYNDKRYWLTGTDTRVPSINNFGGSSAIYAIGIA